MVNTEDNNIALKIAHLSMIQGAIGRMSGFSASAKTFTVTILAGLAAISLQADKAQLGIVAMLASIVLGGLDVYYMTLELRFRAFYEHVESRNLDRADDLAIRPLRRSGDIVRALNSAPTKLFYLPIFAACVLFIGYGLGHDWFSASKRLHESNPSCVEQSVDSKANRSVERIEQLSQPATIQSAGTAGQRLGQPESTGIGKSVQSGVAANSATR